MRAAIKVKKAAVKEIVKVTFPEYRGRTFKVQYTESVTFHDTNWGGGSRTEYKIVKRGVGVAKVTVDAPWCNVIEGQTVELDHDHLIVAHSVFCGHDCGITVYAHPMLETQRLASG